MANDVQIGVKLKADGTGLVQAVKLSRDELDRLKAATDRTGKAKRDFKKDTDSAAGSAKRFASQLLSVRGILSGLGAGLSLAGLVSMTRNVLTASDAAGKLSQSLGITVESLTALQHAADMSGVSSESLSTSIRTLSRTASDAAAGSGQAAKAFASLGVSATDATGQLRDADELLMDLADRFAAMPDGVAKTNAAMRLFGKSGAEMIPFLNEGREGITALKEEAQRLGKVVSTDMAKASADFNDNLSRMSGALKGLGMQFVNAMMPTLSRFAEAAASAAGTVGNVLVPNMQLLINTGLILAAGAIPKAILAIGTAALAAARGVTALTVALARNPIGLIAVTLSMAISALVLFRDEMVKIGETTASVMDWVQATWQETGGKLVSWARETYDAIAGRITAWAAESGDTLARVGQWFADLFTGLAGWARDGINVTVGLFVAFGQTVGTIAAGLVESFRNAFVNIRSLAVSFWDGVQQVFRGDISFSAFRDALHKGFVEPSAQAAGEIRGHFRAAFETDYIGDAQTGILKGVNALTERIGAAAAALREKREAANQAKDANDNLTKSLRGVEDGADDAAGAIQGLTGSARDGAREMRELTRTYEDWLRITEEGLALTRQMFTPTEKYQHEQARLQRLLDAGAISQETFNRALTVAREEMERAADVVDPMAQVFKDAASDIHRAWVDMFHDVFDKGLKGFKSLGTNLLNVFKRMLSQMAAQALARPILMPVMSAMGGMMGVPQGAQAAMFQQMGFGGGTGGGGTTLNMANLVNSIPTLTPPAFLGDGMAASLFSQIPTMAVVAAASSMTAQWLTSFIGGDQKRAGQFGAFLGGIPGAILGKIFGGKPSDKAQFGSIDLATGQTFDVAGQTGKKFSQENADARDTVLGAAGMLAQGLSELTGNVVDERIRVHIGSRDGLRLTVGDGREQNFGSDAERLLQATMNAVIDAATGIDAAWKRLVKGLKGTPEEILQALQALHNLDASLDALKDSGNGLADTIAALNGSVSSALDAFQQALAGGNAKQVIGAMDRAHQAVMQRYQAEIQMATELYQRVLEIQRASQNFQVEVGSRINELAPSAELQNLLTGFLNQSLATAFDPSIKPERQVAALEEALALLDQWLSASREAIERNLETQVRGLEDERRLIEDVSRERLEGLQEEFRLAQQWTQVLSSARRLIEQMTFTQANPLPTSARLNLASAEVERLQGAFQAASGEKRVSIGQDLLKALETQLQLSQELFQRPSPEYLDAYNAIIRQVSELEGVAQSEADRAAAIQQEISYLNDLQVEHLAAIDARIEALRASADQRLAEVNATALELYRAIQHQGTQAYEQLERQAKEQLDVLLQGQTYDAFIAERQAEAVRLLEQIRDGVRAFAGIDGSHSSGLAYVPYDGYRAELHEGERVLTREEARQYREPVRLAPPRPAPQSQGDVAVTVHVAMPAITVSGGEGGEQAAKDIMREIKRELPALITRGIKDAAPMIRRDILTN